MLDTRFLPSKIWSINSSTDSSTEEDYFTIKPQDLTLDQKVQADQIQARYIGNITFTDLPVLFASF